MGHREVGRFRHGVLCIIMVAVLVGYKNALVGTGWAVSLLYCAKLA